MQDNKVLQKETYVAILSQLFCKNIAYYLHFYEGVSTR